MPYTKPGVEVKQEQRSATPILPSPELDSCIIGNVYHWQDPNWEDETISNLNSVYSETYDGSELTVTVSGINDDYYDVIDGSIVIDLVGTQGPNTGTLTHLIPDEDFSYAGGTITISGNAGPYQSGNSEEAQVRVGYLSYKQDTAGKLIRLNSLLDLQQQVGEPVSWNPLAFGAFLAMENSGSETYVFGLSDKSGDETTHTNAQDKLKLEDMYALGILDGSVDPTSYKTHVEEQSSPTKKHERIAIVNEEYTYTGTNSTDAEGIRDRNSAYGSRRVFSTHPYAGYVEETRHISTIKPSYISSVFSGLEAGSLTARFISDITVGNKKYKANDPITETVWTHLVANDFGSSNGLVTVLAPVPGYYYAAIVAGQVAGKTPEQPLTNVPIAGVDQTEGSQDKFIEDDLDTMGSGGTYIMTQTNSQSPIVSRHQVSTDVTSVAKRELSITNALDYTAKFLRGALSPYIGRFNITPAFLKLVNSILVSSSLFLTRSGIVQDINNITVNQDENNPDTINVTLNVKVKYPVNYIKITLIF